MKLFETLDMNALRESWKEKDNTELSFYGGKNPAFTPAIQGQDNGMMPYSGFHIIQHFTMYW